MNTETLTCSIRLPCGRSRDMNPLSMQLYFLGTIGGGRPAFTFKKTPILSVSLQTLDPPRIRKASSSSPAPPDPRRSDCSRCIARPGVLIALPPLEIRDLDRRAGD